MSDQVIVPSRGDLITLEAQDRRPPLSASRLVTIGLSLLVLWAALYQLRGLNPASIFALLPSSTLFWILFGAMVLAGPLSEWLIFRKLWGVGPAALGALTRKLIYNELLVGYIGEVYFYAWARKAQQVKASPFGAVKDVAILSALAGNVMTLVFILLAFPFLNLLPLGEHAHSIAWSLAIIIGISLVVTIWRKKIFSLKRAELQMVFVIHVARIVATTALAGALWFLAMPDTPLGWWVVLATIRLLISRLPFVPNKDIVFAGVAALAIGGSSEIGALMALMAGLLLATYLLAGLTFALADILSKGDDYAPHR